MMIHPKRIAISERVGLIEGSCSNRMSSSFTL